MYLSLTIGETEQISVGTRQVSSRILWSLIIAEYFEKLSIGRPFMNPETMSSVHRADCILISEQGEIIQWSRTRTSPLT